FTVDGSQWGNFCDQRGMESLQAPPLESLSRIVPIEVEGIAFVINHCKLAAALCDFAAADRPSIVITVNGSSLNSDRAGTKAILVCRPKPEVEQDGLLLFVVLGTLDYTDPHFFCLRTNHNRVRLSITRNVCNDCRIGMPSCTWACFAEDINASFLCMVLLGGRGNSE